MGRSGSLLPTETSSGSQLSRRWTRAVGWLAAVGCASAMVSCGNSSAQVSSSNECARVAPSKYLSEARVAFIGTMMAGRTVEVANGSVLLSPAKVRVSHYLKGHGPKVVRVVTGVVSTSVDNAEGIEPQIGQRWIIYSPSRSAPYDTNVCNGSKQLK